jgi:hypothetical protein
MDLVTRFDGIVRQLLNFVEPVTPAQLYHRFLEASLQSKGTHHQLLATAIYTNPAPLTYDQIKIRFEKSALQSAQGAPPPHAAVAAPDPASKVNYVGSSGPSGSRGSHSHSHSQAASGNSMGRQQSEGYRCNICGEKNHLARTCSFRPQVDALVQRHKRDHQRSGGQRPRNPKKNKARHGFSSRDSAGPADLRAVLLPIARNCVGPITMK